MLRPHDIRDRRKVIPIHDAIPARLSPEYRKGMSGSVLLGLAKKIAADAQALDMTPTPVVAYDSLAPAEQARADDAARCAIRWCDPREHEDAILRLRSELAVKLYQTPFHKLPQMEQQWVCEVASLYHSTVKAHFSGYYSPLTPAERYELTTGESGGGAA